MRPQKCLRTLAPALIMATAVLTSSGAATASTYKMLHQFELPKNPTGSLTIDAAGNLYGTTEHGGTAFCPRIGTGCGFVWKLAPNGTVNLLLQFGGGDGGNPTNAGVVLDAAGNLYGTTFAGGDHTVCTSGCGVVFKLAPNPDGTWTESVLHRFTGGADGRYPPAGLIFDAAGSLYGTTAGGGSTACSGGCGVVFKLTPTASGWRETVLHTFLGQAKIPSAPVIFDSAGNLYGTTCCGSTNYGVVFEITP